jgi:NADH-quinone oxidoreductase subunit N
MSPSLAIAAVKAPHIDYAGLSPYLALTAGALLVLLLGLARGRWIRHATPLLSIATLGTAIGLGIWRFDHPASLVSGALVLDDLTLVLLFAFAAAGIATVLLAWRARAVEEAGHGELFALTLFSILGMAILVAATNLVTLFLGFELLSIPLYVLCATELRRAGSLESGLKYLVVGSVGSATLVYGLALIYGATGSTDFAAINDAISNGGVAKDALLLTGVALSLVGLAFKASVAPFHQWTPDVYEGAPTPVTAFMAVATKAAALGVLLRLCDSALIGAQSDWQPAVAALAAFTIVVGNVGALGQHSLKRMLAYSGVAQAGYLLAGVVVATQLGAKATVFYLVVYLAMNVAAFAVIVARERANAAGGDDLANFAGLGRTQPALAWPLTIAMLALAGIPATAGFIGKVYLIDALVDGGYTWLAIVLVVGSMISLGYYLRVVAAMWMRDAPSAETAVPAAAPAGALATPAPMAGGSQEADALAPDGAAGPAPSVDGAPARVDPEVLLVAWLCAAATIVLGIVPSPLFRLAGHAGRALSGIF